MSDIDGRLGPRTAHRYVRALSAPSDRKWARAGAFDPGSKSFAVERFPTLEDARLIEIVPLAPQVRRDVFRSVTDHETTVVWELVAACPSCHADVRLVWHDSVSDTLLERIEDAVGQERAARGREVADLRRQFADARRTAKVERSRAVKAQRGNAKKRRGW